MAYISGTLTDANPGAALYALMEPALTTAGYTLVDTVVISTRTHKIWKSAAANNSQAIDWYVDISYLTTGASHVACLPMEYFDPATDLAYRMVTYGSSTTIDATTYTKYGATGQTLESANLTPNTGNATNLSLHTSTSNFAYWISITGDRIAGITSITPTYFVYAGVYTPIEPHSSYAGASKYPLVAVKFDNQALGQSPMFNVAINRVPKVTTLAGTSWQYLMEVVPAWSQYSLPQIGSGDTSIVGARYVTQYLVRTHSQAIAQGSWGYLIDVACANGGSSAGILRGDIATIGGQTWVFTSYAGNNIANLVRAI